MHVVALHLLNFRNYARLDLELPLGPLVVHGGNAQGKSNLLDAVHILATGRSLRSGPEAAWINVNAPDAAHFARVRAHVQAAAEEEHLELVVARTSAGAASGAGCASAAPRGGWPICRAVCRPSASRRRI